MQQSIGVVTEGAAYPEESELESAASGERLLAQAYQAVNKLDLNECTRIAQWARDNRHPAAGPALCALLRKPRSLNGLRSWRRPGWIQMRIAAIEALTLNRDHLAAPTLAHVLIHDVREVRDSARVAMQSIGSSAVLPIVDTIRVSTDWPLGGMICAIETLGLICEKSAGPTLARILFGLLPNSSSRWTRVHLKWAAALGAIESAIILSMNSWHFGGDVPIYLLAIWATSLFLFLTFFSYLGVFVFIRRGKRSEANTVNAAAANALINIKDPRAVPSLVEVATEKYSQSARAGAVNALCATLPVLNASDYGLLTGAVERRLTGMFAWHNPSLILASVRALEFVGTGQSVGPVERLARRKSGPDMEIRAEAERVLPVLVERKRLEEAPSVLLRPSQIAPESSGMLLRPVSSLSAYEEPVDQLLTPSQAVRPNTLIP